MLLSCEVVIDFTHIICFLPLSFSRDFYKEFAIA